MKKCFACNRVYSRSQWSLLLPANPDKLVTHDFFNGKCIEWRNCICGSTLTKEIACDCVGMKKDKLNQEVNLILKEFLKDI